MTARLKLGAQALAVGLVLALLDLLIWKVAFTNNGGGVASKIDKGKIVVAPNFTLTRLDKPGRLQLASLRGKAVVLNFWASWCLPCNKEAPTLERAWQDHDGHVVVLGVDVNDFAGEAHKFMRQHRVTYPIVNDNHYVTWGTYGLLGVPETFFVDPRGRVVGHVAGPVSAADLRAGIERALTA